MFYWLHPYNSKYRARVEKRKGFVSQQTPIQTNKTLLNLLVTQPLDVLRLEPLLPRGDRGLFIFLPLTQFWHELSVVALALELLQGAVYLITVINFNYQHVLYGLLAVWSGTAPGISPGPLGYSSMNYTLYVARLGHWEYSNRGCRNEAHVVK